MRYIIVLLLSCCLACEEPAPVKQPIPLTEDSTFLTGTFFVVRQAAYDSCAPEADQKRASELYRYLKDSAIQRIYINNLVQTALVTDSLREYLHIDTVSYKADSTGEGLIYEIIRRDDWGKNLLVVGKETKMLPVVRSLKAKAPADSIGYSDLLVIRKFRDSVKSKKFNYSKIVSATEK
jgi:hypothetical protein